MDSSPVMRTSDHFYLNDGFDDGEDQEPTDVTCKYCGEEELAWQEIVKADGTLGHVLFTQAGHRHVCDRSAKADEFDVC